jgi:hypothetical protein
MPADGFTKPLSAEKHAHFVKQLGLVDISSLIDPGYISEEESPYDDHISSDTELNQGGCVAVQACNVVD